MQEPLSDNEVDDLLKAAGDILKPHHAKTTQGQTALDAARVALNLISLGLIKAGLKRQPDP